MLGGIYIFQLAIKLPPNLSGYVFKAPGQIYRGEKVMKLPIRCLRAVRALGCTRRSVLGPGYVTIKCKGSRNDAA